MVIQMNSIRGCMRHTLLSILIINSLTFLIASPSQSETGNVEDKLLANGSFGHTPITQAMLYDESELRKTWLNDNKIISKQIEGRVKELQKEGVPKNLNDIQRAEAILDWTEALNRAHATYAYKTRVLDDAKEANRVITEKFVSYLEILAPGKKWKDAGGGPLNSTASKLGSNALTNWIEERMDRMMNAGTEHKNSVNNAVEYALYYADIELIKKWGKKWKNQSPTDAEIQEATRELLPEAGSFFVEGPGAKLSREARIEMLSVQSDALKNGVLQVSIKRSGSKSEETTARKNLSSKFDEGKLDKSSKEIRDFRKSLTIQTKAVEAFAESTQRQLTELKDQISVVDNKFGAVQLTMWRQMGPRERLFALQDGFLPLEKNATDEQIRKRQDDIAELKKIVRILDERDELLSKLDVLAGIGKFAAVVGLPIDTYNFNRNISIASSIVNAISAYAMGNPLAAIQQIGGIFGAGGEDPNVAQFNAVNKKLDLIIEKLEAINKNISLLSDQVAHGFQGLHEKLNIIEEKIEFGNLIGGQLIQDQGYQACRQFVYSAMKNGMQNGLYPSYTARKKHFDEDYRSDSYFKNCRNYLSALVEVSPKNRNFGSDANTQAVTRLELLAGTHNPESVGKSNSRTKQLNEMWMVTMLALGWVDQEGSPRINCMRRGLAFMAGGNRLYSEIEASDLSCSDKDITPDKVRSLQISWKDPGSEHLSELDAHDAMQNALSPGAVRHFGEIVLFVAPFTELARPISPNSNIYELPSLSELSNKNHDISSTVTHYRDWPHHYTDVINLAIAQQTVMSGIYIAKAIANELKTHKFYESYSFIKVDEHGKSINKTIKDEAGKDVLVPVTIAESLEIDNSKSCNITLNSWKESNRGVAILCLLKRYPELASNVVNILVRDELKSTQTNKNVYTFALEANDESHLRQNVLPLLADIITRKSKNSAWGINFRDERGKKDTMDKCDKKEIDAGACNEVEKAVNRILLPRASAVWSDIAAYPYNAEQLFDLRDLLEERIVALQAHKFILEKKNKNLEWVMRRSSASIRSLIEVPITTFLEPAASTTEVSTVPLSN